MKIVSFYGKDASSVDTHSAILRAERNVPKFHLFLYIARAEFKTRKGAQHYD
jgi:hypothetical protein